MGHPLPPDPEGREMPPFFQGKTGKIYSLFQTFQCSQISRQNVHNFKPQQSNCIPAFRPRGTSFRSLNLRPLFVRIQAMHFDRDDVDLPGFHKFFKESAEEEMEHAQKVNSTS